MNNRIISHIILSKSLPIKNEDFLEKRIPVTINRPGKLSLWVKAEGTFKNFLDPADIHGPRKPIRIGEIKGFTIKLTDPLGNDFNKTSITTTDLNNFRNLRGILDGSWTAIIDSNFKGGPTFVKGNVSFSATVQETVDSSSAKALVDVETTINGQKEFSFDLYRLGNLKVIVTKKMGFVSMPDVNAKISLLDPDGNQVQRSSNGAFAIKMAHLKHSRKEGKVQNWKIVISGVDGKRKVFAQVYDSINIPKELLLDRLNFMLGKNGENFEVKCNWIGGELFNRITIKPKTNFLAENLKYYEIIKKINPASNYENIEVNKEYTLYEKRAYYKKIIKDEGILQEWEASTDIKFKNFKIENTDFEIKNSSKREYNSFNLSYPSFDIDTTSPFLHFNTGVSEIKKITIPAEKPMIRVKANTSGYIDMINVIELFTDVAPNVKNISISNLLLEIVFEVSDGRIMCNCWVDFKTNIIGALPLTNASIEDLFKSMVRGLKLKDINEALTNTVEDILDQMLGGVFDITATRWNSTTNSIEIEYIPDVLSERKPNPNYNSGDPGNFSPLKENSWKSPQLTTDPDKIKHIVVLMMENRSFDHVLGYLSLENAKGNGEAAINPLVQGLTPLVKEQFSNDTYRIQHLKNAEFKESTSSETGKIRTKIPIGVGHGYTDVSEQIEGGTMKGFVKNFLHYHPTELKKDIHGNTPQKVHPQDVLGYYTDEELKMYKYFTDNFAICDNYFSSHPGPTLPNRMFSLCGDLQKDRNGEPKLENSVDTSFFLSRELNIFDILDQHEVSWKVYESFPSVTMLRMFSRYAGENKRIVNIEQLKSDLSPQSLRSNEFPSVVFIDPAMHDAPMNDDHPPADMLYGQELVKEIYDALSSNEEVWKHTLFVINYDEHGGLFDHVSPPIAETYMTPLSIGFPGDTGGSNAKPPVRVKYGVRVPCFIVSPYVEKGSVFSKRLDHTSILKTILIKFCNNEKPFLSNRVNAANSLGGALKSELRNNIPISPKKIPMPDTHASKSKLQVLKAVGKNFTPMTKEKLSSKDADFHEMLAFLGRMVKPPIEKQLKQSLDQISDVRTKRN